MKNIESLQKAIRSSSAHQERLRAVKSEEEAVSALLEIAGAEGVTLSRADLQQQISVAGKQDGCLKEDDLAKISGGHSGIYRERPTWTSFVQKILPDQYPS